MSEVAAVQMASGPNIEANLLEAGRLISTAVEQGAQLIVLPENFAYMAKHEAAKTSVCEKAGNGRIQSWLSEQAIRHGVWIVGGTVPLETPVKDKVYASCLVFNDQGIQVARYDKIHLFDVTLVEHQEQYHESAAIRPGQDILVVPTPFGKLGLAVCYDLRFPELFRAMLDQGVELIALPSAFTFHTGQAHWEILIRARAIENLIYLIAADQGGYHVNGRETYGNSMVVDPWGNVLDRLQQGPGIAKATVDLSFLARTRRAFPALNHRCLGLASGAGNSR
jgi:nitrilase